MVLHEGSSPVRNAQIRRSVFFEFEELEPGLERTTYFDIVGF